MRIPHNEPLGSDSSGSQTANESSAERKCILTGGHGSRDTLIRLAISPAKADGSCDVLPDALARAPGRGAWIGVSRSELEVALGKGKLKGALARAFGKSLGGATLNIPADLGAKIEAALLRAFTDRIGLEMRSGKLLTGSDRIAENARSGKVSWLAHAADAGEDGSRKLDQAWRVGEDVEGSGKAGITLPLDRSALSVALGRDNVVHLALTDRAAAQRVAAPLERLLHFMGCDSAAGANLNDRTAKSAAPAEVTTI